MTNIGAEAKSCEPTFDEQSSQFVVQQAFDLWITPEIDRRVAAGQLVPPVTLVSAQVIFPPAGDVTVRLNDEVRGIAWTRLSRTVEKGDAVMQSDLTELQGFDLDKSELDFGHFTLLGTPAGWFASFNFLTLRGRGLDLLQKAKHFLEAATVAREKGHAAVTIDNLFSACELASKAQLVVHRLLDIDANHRAIHSRINTQKKMGNADGAFVDLFNKLAQIRPRYRYDTGFTESIPVTESDLDLVKLTINSNERQLEQQRLR